MALQSIQLTAEKSPGLSPGFLGSLLPCVVVVGVLLRMFGAPKSVAILTSVSGWALGVGLAACIYNTLPTSAGVLWIVFGLGASAFTIWLAIQKTR